MCVWESVCEDFSMSVDVFNPYKCCEWETEERSCKTWYWFEIHVATQRVHKAIKSTTNIFSHSNITCLCVKTMFECKYMHASVCVCVWSQCSCLCREKTTTYSFISHFMCFSTLIHALAFIMPQLVSLLTSGREKSVSRQS